MKVLNLYAGIGGNRKLWPDKCKVTAVELNPEIAAIYQDFFPDDKVIIGDAHQYLLDHYKEFDFIWSSPPCQSHSRARHMGAGKGAYPPIYPDLKLYEEIIFLKHNVSYPWGVENVQGYYIPLIKPQPLGRHYIWSNYYIPKKDFESSNIENIHSGAAPVYGFDIRKYKLKGRGIKRSILRNLIPPELGLHIFNSAFKQKQQRLADTCLKGGQNVFLP